MTQAIDSAITLRDATAADIPHVFRLVRGLADHERKLGEFVVTETNLYRMLFGPTPRAHAILAAPVGSSPVGIALFYYTVSTFAGRTGIFLEDLFVEPSHRGTGIGYALLRHLAERAAAENCNVIEWRVLDWNQPAIDFYDRLGATRMSGWHVRQLRGSALADLAKGADHG
jgi:GNAT superfamily N-acetyltransferase